MIAIKEHHELSKFVNRFGRVIISQYPKCQYRIEYMDTLLISCINPVECFIYKSKAEIINVWTRSVWLPAQRRFKMLLKFCYYPQLQLTVPNYEIILAVKSIHDTLCPYKLAWIYNGVVCGCSLDWWFVGYVGKNVHK